MVKVIGITGLMGSGKSFISALLNMEGGIKYNMDVVAKSVQMKSKDLKDKIIAKFGEKYYNGFVINVEYAKALYFAGTDESKENLKWINETIQPYIIENFEHFKKIVSDDYPYIIVESAILFETGFHKYCDYIIGVKSPNPIMKTYERDYTTKEEWQIRMASQLPESEKSFDFIISNDYTNNVEKQVVELHKQIMLKIQN